MNQLMLLFLRMFENSLVSSMHFDSWRRVFSLICGLYGFSHWFIDKCL